MPAVRSREGHRALVLGLGRTGVAVLRHLRRRGSFARGADRRSDLSLPADLQEAADVEIRTGDEDASLLEGIDLVVPSPGVPATSPLLREAVARGIPVYLLDRNVPIVERALDAPHTRHPDALARSPRKPLRKRIAATRTRLAGCVSRRRPSSSVRPRSCRRRSMRSTRCRAGSPFLRPGRRSACSWCREHRAAAHRARRAEG